MQRLLLHRIIHSISSLSEIPNAHTPSAPILDEERVVQTIDDPKGTLHVMRMNVENLHYVFCTWVLARGWKPTQYSVEAMLAADPKGYYLLFKDGSPIASISAVCDSNTKNAHIGLFIVIEPYQGKGFGKILWEAVVAKLLQEGYTVSLNAVPSGTRADQAL